MAETARANSIRIFYFWRLAVRPRLSSRTKSRGSVILRRSFLALVRFPSYEAFRKGLGDVGYVEGKNIAIECRSANGDAQRLVGLATELVQLKAAVIVAAGGELVARAAQQASQTIPHRYDQRLRSGRHRTGGQLGATRRYAYRTEHHVPRVERQTVGTVKGSRCEDSPGSGVFESQDPVQWVGVQGNGGGGRIPSVFNCKQLKSAEQKISTEALPLS